MPFFLINITKVIYIILFKSWLQILFGIKIQNQIYLLLRQKVFPNQLFLLSNPLFNDKEIIIKKSCINGNLNKLLNISYENEKFTKNIEFSVIKIKNNQKNLNSLLLLLLYLFKFYLIFNFQL